MTDNMEHLHDDVFGKSFELYGRRELEEFIEPLAQRYERNGIDPQEAFSGKVCLDAGCGNGRGSVYMMSNGARSVDSVDISPKNIKSTERNLKLFGHSNFTCTQSSLETLPFEDNSFDFVWCNGVIMHTANPDACLAEISRVLKTGGQAWIYVYGAGGLYWYAMRRFRQQLKNVDIDACLDGLRLMRYSTRYVAEFMDDWKVPYLRTYTAEDFSNRLGSFGYETPTPLPRGVVYDTSERRHSYPQSAAWVGDGDLRYFLTKTSAPQGSSSALSDSEYGSEVTFGAQITSRFGPLFDALFDGINDNPLLAIAQCGYVHKGLRDLLSVEGDLNVDAFEETLQMAKTLSGHL